MRCGAVADEANSKPPSLVQRARDSIVGTPVFLAVRSMRPSDRRRPGKNELSHCGDNPSDEVVGRLWLLRSNAIHFASNFCVTGRHKFRPVVVLATSVFAIQRASFGPSKVSPAGVTGAEQRNFAFPMTDGPACAVCGSSSFPRAFSDGWPLL